ncbi:MAG: metallophosphoesterase family protein, partial [Planctomycetota bacterium]
MPSITDVPRRLPIVPLIPLLLVLLAGSAASQVPGELVRGPYLQMGGPDRVTIRWRTASPQDSVVNLGPSASSLPIVVSDPAMTTEHSVTVLGLSPETAYHYAIGSTGFGTLAGGDDAHRFVTAPPPGAERPLRIWAIGDSGTGNQYARLVRDAYYAFTGRTHTDLWLMLGDNAYTSGTDAQYQTAVFQNMYEEMLTRSVLWPTLGNHDGISADSATETGPYYDIFELPRMGEVGGLASGTEAYYSFDWGNVHFVCLDSHETDRSPTGPMATRLAADLAANAST